MMPTRYECFFKAQLLVWNCQNTTQVLSNVFFVALYCTSVNEARRVGIHPLLFSCFPLYQLL
jgi:hypothetical protein